MEDSTFASMLRHYRRRAGLTQAALAERASLSERAVNDLERDAMRRPHRETVDLLSRALALTSPERDRLRAAARRRAPAPSPAPESEQPGPAGTSRMPLVGRGAERVLLERHLLPAGPPMLLLTGEPGIGKTRLLEETMQHAIGLGWQVVSGDCQRMGDQGPYAPLRDALARTLASIHADLRPAALRGCAWLARLLPELAGILEPLPVGSLPPAQERRLIFEAVALFLTNAAGERGTLLVLDDLQWADDDALSLLTALARAAEPPIAMSAPPLRIMGAYRDDAIESGVPLSSTLAELAHAGLITLRALAPLSRHETRLLLDMLLPRELGGSDSPIASLGVSLKERLVQRAEGLPLFVVSYAQELAAAALLGTRTGIAQQAAALPWTVKQSVRQRLAPLPEDTRVVLDAAAVVGHVVPVDLVAQVVPFPAGQVPAALDAAYHVQLLEDDGNADYRFSHDIIREVLEAELTSVRQARLHLRVAEALERSSPPPVEALAYHYARGGRLEKSVPYLEQAGDRALSQQAHATAERHYRQLVAQLDTLGRRLDAARIREKWGAVLRTMAQFDAALRALEEGAAVYKAAGDLESVARTAAAIGQLYRDIGEPQAGLRRLQAILPLPDDSVPSYGRAALLCQLADLLSVAGRHEEALVAAIRAEDVGRLTGDVRIGARATHRRGAALLVLGQSEEARAVIEQAIARAEEAGDLEYLCSSLHLMARLQTGLGDFDAAGWFCTRALTVAQQRGDLDQIVYMAQHAKLPALFLGEWAEARRGFEEALTLYRSMDRFWAKAVMLFFLGWVALWQGDWDAATQALDESSALANRDGPVELVWQAEALRAELDILQGHPEEALARLNAGLNRGTVAGVHTGCFLTCLAWAQFELGELTEAVLAADQAVARARDRGFRVSLVAALRMQARVALRQGRIVEAEHALEEGLTLARGMRYRYAEGRLLYVHGELYAQQGRVAQAQECLASALAMFERLGARHDAEQARRAHASVSLGDPASA